jgi:galactokinase
VTEISRVLETVATLKSKGPVAIGGLLKASHDSLRDDYAVSIPELDLAVEAAIDAGALGARMTGGGFGGAAIALTPTSKLGVVSESVKHAFASAGYLAPNIFAVTAADGAKREV